MIAHESGNVCARCATMHPTCCRIPPDQPGQPDQKDLCFPLSSHERQRLEPYHVLRDGPCFAQSMSTKPFLRHLRRLFPRDAATLNRLFPLGKPHLRLALTSDGSCVFLSPSGCVVAEEDRPFYCRMYPFWFVGKRLTGFASSACLALQSSCTPEGLFPLFNTNRSALWELYSRLRVSWGMDEPPRDS